jgi:cytosine/uracil/thiamine/allantoin permease
MANKENIPDDPYARESFTFRRMTRGQLWAITVVVALLAILAVAYSVA